MLRLVNQSAVVTGNVRYISVIRDLARMGAKIGSKIGSGCALLEQERDAIVLTVTGGVVQRCVLVVVRRINGRTRL